MSPIVSNRYPGTQPPLNPGRFNATRQSEQVGTMENFRGHYRVGMGAREGQDEMAAARRLLAAGVATLGGVGASCVDPRVRSLTGLPMTGWAFPIRCAPGDNLAIHVGLLHAAPGSVLVVDASAVPDLGYWGEILTEAAQARGVAGLVIDGSIRDIDSLRARGFAVYATGVAARGTTKALGGEVAVPVSVGGADVRLGDFIVGDSDGVAVVAADDWEAVLARADDRSAWEADAIRQIRSGVNTVELFGLDVDRVQVAPTAIR
jgi:4-hydroxy-4-methyl-2-oxoglutarate aldolase